ncbi:CARDB domain-containing protein [Candidatus Omnitrophota bacterium]
MFSKIKKICLLALATFFMVSFSLVVSFCLLAAPLGQKEPPAKNIDLVAIKIAFISAEGRRDVNEVLVGQRGTIKATIRNDSNERLAEVPCDILVNGRVAANTKVTMDPNQLGYPEAADYNFNAPGDYKLLVKVDPENHIHETQENNNHFVRTLKVVEPEPEEDVRVEKITVFNQNRIAVDSISANARATIRVDVRNTSAVPMRNIVVRIYKDGGLIDGTSVSLLPNESRPLEFTRVLISRVLGIFVLSGVADPDDRIHETNEDNNIAEKKIEVVGKSDLHAIDINVRNQETGLETEELTEKDPYVIRASFMNRGVITVPHALLDIEINGDRAHVRTVNCPPGVVRTLNIENNVFERPGKYTIKMILDPKDQEVESDETNNTAFTNVDVALNN